MGDGDEVDVVVEETVALPGDAVVGKELGQQFEVEEAVGGAEEHLLTVVAALGDVMGNTGQNEAIGPWHQLLSRNQPLLLSGAEVFDPVFA